MEGDRKITLKQPQYAMAVRSEFGNPVIPYTEIQVWARRVDRGSKATISLDEDAFIGNSDHIFETRQLPVLREANKDWILIDEKEREHEVLAVQEVEKPGAQMRGGHYWFWTVEKASG